MLEEDLAVFFDAEELAETITVEGVELVGFLAENKKTPSKSDQYGVFIEKKVLSIKKEDWDELGSPSYGNTLNINGENFEIKEINDKCGVIKMEIEGNRT